MITVSLRFDDPSATSDRELEEGILAAAKRHGTPLTLAVIPFRRVAEELLVLDQERAAHLVAAQADGIIEIALHGHSHEQRATTSHGQPSEFVGLPLKTQQQLIQDGLTRLCALFPRPVTGFVPPWNSFDAVTAVCVADAGLRYLSAGWENPTNARTPRLLPRTCQVSRIREAVAEARRFGRLAPIVVGVMHHYDFAESGSPQAVMDLVRFEELLAWLAAQSDVCIRPLGELSRELSPGSLVRAMRRRRLADRLPWRWRKAIPDNSLLTAPLWRIWFEGGRA